MLGSRGQEEAPFSLLLAVAMMALVIPIAAYMFQNFQTWECHQRISNNLESFARELELASTLGGGKRIVDVDLSLYSCPGIRVDNFTLTQPGQDRCQEMCHDPNCRVLEAVYEDFDPDTGQSLGLSVATEPVCVRIPVNVAFITTDCQPPEEVPLGESLTPGYYRLSLTKEGYKVKICQIPVKRYHS